MLFLLWDVSTSPKAVRSQSALTQIISCCLVLVLWRTFEDPIALDGCGRLWKAVEVGLTLRGLVVRRALPWLRGSSGTLSKQQQRRSARNTRQSVVYTGAAAVINDRAVCCSGQPLGTAAHQSSCKTNLTLANPPPHLLPPWLPSDPQPLSAARTPSVTPGS